MKERIAKITGTFLGYEDHGILTAQLHLDYGGSAQSTPGHFCDRHIDGSVGYDTATSRVGTAYGMEFIRRLMLAVGASKWEDIKGRTVIALIDDNTMVAGIKPLPTEHGTPFMFRDLAWMSEAQSA